MWHGIAKTNNGYYFGTYSLLDDRDSIMFFFEQSNNAVIEDVIKNRLVKYYLEYTQDFPLIKIDENGNVKIYAIKYGPIIILERQNLFTRFHLMLIYCKMKILKLNILKNLRGLFKIILRY